MDVTVETNAAGDKEPPPPIESFEDMNLVGAHLRPETPNRALPLLDESECRPTARRDDVIHVIASPFRPFRLPPMSPVKNIHPPTAASSCRKEVKKERDDLTPPTHSHRRSASPV